MTTPHDIRLLYYYWIPSRRVQAKLEQGAQANKKHKRTSTCKDHNDNDNDKECTDDKVHTEHTEQCQELLSVFLEK